EACTQLLRALPADSGMSIIIVQHLAPLHDSLLPQLLSSATGIPVLQVTDGMVIRPNHVYVTPPNVQMQIVDGPRLSLIPRPDDRAHYMPIDFFLRSLAEYAQGRAIGIVLSGTASDGAIGLREI